MYCKNCGNRIGRTEKFCTNCGTPVDSTKVSSPNKSENNNSLSKIIGSGVFILVAIIVASIVRTGISQISGSLSPNNTGSKSQLISEAVKELKAEMILPQQLDDITKLIDVTAEPNAIRYHYILSDVDTTSFTTSDLKTNLISNVCHNDQTKKTIDMCQ